ncbi:MAG TPA: type I-U CRISPR-associated protein Csb2, partial [Myxococcota bacterium]|nr:type I-U CRISPR-associated protein Csb2 [Myxococcota bacterium]
MNLVMRVSLHAPLFHGSPDWPPAPARLFQALVAGAGQLLDDAATTLAFEWLESQAPPLIAAPTCKLGQAATTFVPNNDLDAKGGHPSKLPELRVAKRVQARQLAHRDLLYVWTAIAAPDAESLIPLATHLYQLGRGVDMAYARGELLDDGALDELMRRWDGTVHRPTPGAQGEGLACPRPGTLASLRVRHDGFRRRFERIGKGKNATDVFAQPPRPFVAQVTYDAPSQQAVFELRRLDDASSFASRELGDAVATVTAWRDAAVRRLVQAGLRTADVEATLVGRRPGELAPSGASARARIVPLPSVGHEHADQRVRRLVVEVPVGALIGYEDLRWAFSGLVDGDTVLVESRDRTMLDHHYLGQATTFVSVTPLALPSERRRIEPTRQQDEAKGSIERNQEERAAIDSVRQALRHAGVRTPPASIEVQREPFDAHGTRAEACASSPRFPKERLWHVRIRFRGVEKGLMALGDGRFLGLGVMRPEVSGEPERFAFRIVAGLDGELDPLVLARHARRAVIARAQVAWDKGRLPGWITGHEGDGRPASDHKHLSFIVDPPRQRIVVVRPSDSWSSRARREEIVRFSGALSGFNELRAGGMGVLSLATSEVDDDDPVFSTSATWRLVTPYR